MTKFTETNILKLTASLAILFVLVANIYFLYHFILVHTASPLENLQVELSEPVSISAGDPLVATGTYDRRIRCQLNDFDMHFKNMTSDAELILGPEALLKTPPANLSPGVSIPIDFAVRQPYGLTPGIWKPEFHGFYTCASSLFMLQKNVMVNLSALRVVE